MTTLSIQCLIGHEPESVWVPPPTSKEAKKRVPPDRKTNYVQEIQVTPNASVSNQEGRRHEPSLKAK